MEKKKISNFYAKDLRVKIFDKGKLVYKFPDIEDIREYCKEQVNTLWDEVLRFENRKNIMLICLRNSGAEGKVN